MSAEISNKPLSNKRVLVTRAVDQSGQLEELLREQGAEPVSIPLIEFRRIVDDLQCRENLGRLGEFDWILFTSANAIRFFFELLGDQAIPSQVRLICVGSKTADTLREFGYEPNFVPSKFSSQRLTEEINVRPGESILYPSPLEISSKLESNFEELGVEVTRWPIYETLRVGIKPEDKKVLLSGIDAVTFASPSVINSYCDQVPEYQSVLGDAITACIGPMTERRAAELGIQVDVVPEQYTAAGLVNALSRHFQDSKTETKMKPASSQVSSAISVRPRRLRHSAGIRSMVRQVHLAPTDFIYPLFVTSGENVRNPIESMPGQFQLSLDQLNSEIRELVAHGIPSVMLFGLPENKDLVGSEASTPDGIVQKATRIIKEKFPDLVVITDVCLCQYTSHGHCGIVHDQQATDNHQLPHGYVLNDETLVRLNEIALSHAEAGADMVAPSGMIDGMVASIRGALDTSGFEHVSVMSYSIKYQSAYYGPFRDAAKGAPQFGDRNTHQMDPAEHRQAMLEARLDVDEGADFLMVKPALAYLDIIYQAKQNFPERPIVAYNVSGEYSMLKAAAEKGWLNERSVVLETLTGIKRAGADLIITYHAKDVCQWLTQQPK